jgi:hypothetical protein
MVLITLVGRQGLQRKRRQSFFWGWLEHFKTLDPSPFELAVCRRFGTLSPPLSSGPLLESRTHKISCVVETMS